MCLQRQTCPLNHHMRICGGDTNIDEGSFDRNRLDGNIQQPNTSELANIDTVMAGNEDIDTPSPQDISNVFEASYL